MRHLPQPVSFDVTTNFVPQTFHQFVALGPDVAIIAKPFDIDGMIEELVGPA